MKSSAAEGPVVEGRVSITESHFAMISEPDPPLRAMKTLFDVLTWRKLYVLSPVQRTTLASLSLPFVSSLDFSCNLGWSLAWYSWFRRSRTLIFLALGGRQTLSAPKDRLGAQADGNVRDQPHHEAQLQRLILAVSPSSKTWQYDSKRTNSVSRHCPCQPERLHPTRCVEHARRRVNP